MELVHHLLDPGEPLATFDVGREPEAGRVRERPFDGQFGVEDVVLGDEPDAVLQRLVVLVEVEAAVEHRPALGPPQTGDGRGERGLPGPRRTDDRHERPLVQADRHLVDDGLRPAPDRDVGRVEDQFAVVHVLLEAVRGDQEQVTANSDQVVFPHRCLGDPHTVDVGAVVAREIDHEPVPGRGGAELGVEPRHHQVVDDDPVGGVAADGRDRGVVDHMGLEQ